MNWFKSLRKTFRPAPVKRSIRPCLDELESRLAPTVTEFPIPTPDSVPQGIAIGPNGNLWFTEGLASKIGFMTPAGSFTEYPLPLPQAINDASTRGPGGITEGPDGNMWWVEGFGPYASIGRITPTGTIVEFPVQSYDSGGYDNITVGPDGNLWFTEGAGYRIGSINPTTGAITQFSTPNSPRDIVSADGYLWFTGGGDNIGRITTAGTITEFPIPTDPYSYSDGIVAADGYLWFAVTGYGIGRLNPATGAITEFANPAAAAYWGSPTYLTASPDGNVWFGADGSDVIGRITPADVITQFPISSANTTVQYLTAASNGNIWFTEYPANTIGRLIVPPTVTNVSPSSGPTAGGTTVTLTGTGFAGAAAVYFGPNATTNFMVNSDTSITATDPAGLGTVDVTVLNSNGTSVTPNADQFTYIAPPTVSGLSPNTGPNAGGNVVTIVGTGFTGATAVDFGPGNPATNVTVNAAGTQITATEPAGAGTVNVTVTVPAGGTSATSSANQFTYLPATFQVTSTTLLSGNNGFLVTFNAPYNIADLDLYTGDSGGTLTARDVQITGPNGATFGGSSPDTMRFNAVPVDSTHLELILTGINHVAAAQVLAAGNYTVTLDGGSGDSGFKRLSDGAYLDGTGTGTIQVVGNYSTTLTVSAIPATTAVISIGDLVAGPGQTLGVPLVLSGGSGSVSDVASVDLTITPSTSAYTVTGFTVNSAISEVSAAFNPATGALTMSSASPFSTTDSPLLLGTFTFAVPGLGNSGIAPGIDTKTPININVTSVGNRTFGEKSFVGANGFHVSAYLGNLGAPVGVYNGTDVCQLQALIIGAVRALALYPNVDPLLLADVNKDGSVNSADVSQLQARIIGVNSSIPALPSGASGVAVNGADPVLFVGSSYTPNGQPANLGSLTPGSTVLVPLSVFVTAPHGVNVTAAEAAFSFDPKVFTLNGVNTGAIANGSLGGSPFAVAFAEVGPGKLNVIGSSSLGPNLAYGQTATLFLVSLTVRADAPVGGTVFNLMSSEHGLQTDLQDNQGRNLVLSPAPENRAGDNLDGIFTVHSGKPVQLPVGGLKETTATRNQQAGTVTALTPAAWAQLTTLLFAGAANQSVLSSSNAGLAEAATVPTATAEGANQAEPSTGQRPTIWEHFTRRHY